MILTLNTCSSKLKVRIYELTDKMRFSVSARFFHPVKTILSYKIAYLKLV